MRTQIGSEMAKLSFVSSTDLKVDVHKPGDLWWPGLFSTFVIEQQWMMDGWIHGWMDGWMKKQIALVSQ